MTPRHPYRRRWRETIVPLLWIYGAAIILAVALGFSCIATAGATPAASPGEQFAEDHAADICIALDRRPTVPGVVGVLTSLTRHGLSTNESAVALADSVIYVCPIHEPLLRQFIAHYTQGDRIV